MPTGVAKMLHLELVKLMCHWSRMYAAHALQYIFPSSLKMPGYLASQDFTPQFICFTTVSKTEACVHTIKRMQNAHAVLSGSSSNI